MFVKDDRTLRGVAGFGTAGRERMLMKAGRYWKRAT